MKEQGTLKTDHPDLNPLPGKQLPDDGRVTRAVVEALGQGDHEAYSIVYLTYKENIEKLVAHITSCPITGEEITQELFLYLWENHASVDADRSLKRYLYVMARNRAIDHIRKNKKTKEAVLPQEYADAEITVNTAPDQNILERELIRMLDIAIGNMPEQRRAVYKMRLEGFSTEQISQKLKITPENVRKHVSLARKDLATLRSLVVFFLLLP